MPHLLGGLLFFTKKWRFIGLLKFFLIFAGKKFDLEKFRMLDQVSHETQIFVNFVAIFGLLQQQILYFFLKNSVFQNLQKSCFLELFVGKGVNK